MLRLMAKAREKYNEEKGFRNKVSAAAVILTVINLIALAKVGCNSSAMSTFLMIMAVPALGLYYVADGISLIMKFSSIVGKVFGCITDILCIPFFFVGLGSFIYVIIGPIVHVVAILGCFAVAILMPGVIIPCMSGIRGWLGGFEKSEEEEMKADFIKA